MKCKHVINQLNLQENDNSPLTASELAHLKICHHCQRLVEIDQQLELILADHFTPEAVPDHLLKQLDLDLGLEEQSPHGNGWPQPRKTKLPFFTINWRTTAWLSGSGLSIAMLLLFFWFQPFLNTSVGITSLEEMSQLALQDHQRNLPMLHQPKQPESMTAWFATNTPLHVVLPKRQLDNNHKLLGIRGCMLGNCNAAYLLYDKVGARVSLFIVSAADVQFNLSPDQRYTMNYGDHVVTIWQENHQVHALVS